MFCIIKLIYSFIGWKLYLTIIDTIPYDNKLPISYNYIPNHIYKYVNIVKLSGTTRTKCKYKVLFDNKHISIWNMYITCSPFFNKYFGNQHGKRKTRRCYSDSKYDSYVTVISYCNFIYYCHTRLLTIFMNLPLGTNKCLKSSK